MLKTCHVLYNNPTGHYRHPQRHSREKKTKKQNSLYWYFLECEGAGRDTHIASNEHTNCRHVQTGKQDFALTGHK